jgi:hypothetical protein
MKRFEYQSSSIREMDNVTSGYLRSTRSRYDLYPRHGTRLRSRWPQAPRLRAEYLERAAKDEAFRILVLY